MSCAALGLVMTGALLIAVECNRPGRIVPGSVGVLLLLLGLNQLRPFAGWHDPPLWLALAGLTSIALVRWRPRYVMLGVFGTTLLATALVQLARQSGGELGVAPAGCCGVLLGGGCTWLMMVAGHSWRAKRGYGGASAKLLQSGVAERWE